MLRLIRPHIVKRFNHTHIKTVIPQNNNKFMEDLIRQQNETLKDIKEIGLVRNLLISFLTATITLLTGTIALKI